MTQTEDIERRSLANYQGVILDDTSHPFMNISAKKSRGILLAFVNDIDNTRSEGRGRDSVNESDRPSGKKYFIVKGKGGSKYATSAKDYDTSEQLKIALTAFFNWD